MGIRDQPRRESGTGRDENLAPAVIAHSDLHRAFRTPTVTTFCIKHLAEPAKAGWEKKIRERTSARPKPALQGAGLQPAFGGKAP